MGIAGGIVVYAIILTVVLFMVLPFGVTTQAETGEIAPGTEPSAPAVPRLRRKLLIAAGISAVIWGAIEVYMRTMAV